MIEEVFYTDAIWPCETRSVRSEISWTRSTIAGWRQTNGKCPALFQSFYNTSQRSQDSRQEHVGVRHLAKGHLDMKSGGLVIDLLIGRWHALPPELQLPCKDRRKGMYNILFNRHWQYFLLGTKKLVTWGSEKKKKWFVFVLVTKKAD